MLAPRVVCGLWQGLFANLHLAPAAAEVEKQPNGWRLFRFKVPKTGGKVLELDPLTTNFVQLDGDGLFDLPLLLLAEVAIEKVRHVVG